MCVSCGCGAPEEKHGDQRNITYSELKAAADAANIDLRMLASNIQAGLTAGSSRAEALRANVEAMNEPLPSNQFSDKLESTPYPE